MRLLVRMVLPFASTDSYETFECRVQRVIGPAIKRESGGAFVFADVDLPEQYHSYAVKKGWNADGTYRVEAVVRQNRRSLAAFLASGAGELDCSEDA